MYRSSLQKNQSCLRSPDKDKMLDFSFEKQKAELETRAQLLLSVLVAAGSRRTERDEKDWIPAVGMAASILLRNRSAYMNTIQLLLGIFLYHFNWVVSMNILLISCEYKAEILICIPCICVIHFARQVE